MRNRISYASWALHFAVKLSMEQDFMFHLGIKSFTLTHWEKEK